MLVRTYVRASIRFCSHHDTRYLFVEAVDSYLVMEGKVPMPQDRSMTLWATMTPDRARSSHLIALLNLGWPSSSSGNDRLLQGGLPGDLASVSSCCVLIMLWCYAGFAVYKQGRATADIYNCPNRPAFCL